MTIHKTASSGGRPKGSTKARTLPLGMDVVKVVQAAWDTALEACPKDGREVLEAFVEAFDKGEIDGHFAVLVPAVNEIAALLRDSKLEGDPLNYVKRSKNEHRDYAVRCAFDRFRTAAVKMNKDGTPAVDKRQKDGNTTFLFMMSDRDCADAVTKGFHDTGIDRKLTSDNVLQIVKRARSE